MVDHSIEDCVELHPLVVEVLDALDQELFSLADLGLLFACVKLLHLLLEAERELQQITVVFAQLADDSVVRKDAASLEPLD